MNKVAIGVDIGGTFTDVVARDATGRTRIAKVPSTRPDPAEAVRNVLRELLPAWGVAPADVVRFVHGTTVATNAVLERKGSRLGLLSTAGFTDVLEIGRQSRKQIYDLILRPETPVFLAPGAQRRGVVEAISPTGEVTTPLDPESLAAAVQALVDEGVQAIAICFLFSYMNPVHERQAADFIRERHPGLLVSLSSEVDPAFREYERTVVTCFDAYVKAGLDRYLAAMESDLAGAGVPATLQIMQSRGGVCSARVARRRPIRLFLSGPAAGVVGAREVGRSAGHGNIITVDIGGTSSDIALIADGRPVIRPDGLLDGYRIRVPMVDVNSIGSGGGSVAWIDAGGGLRVGPRSAGSQPGPACFGRGGTEATVTDASVVLGLIDPGYFAGGSMKLDRDLALRAVEEKIARPLGMSVLQAALGILRVVNVQMAEGIRLVSISRGVDPRAFALMPFGGGGALHAAALARELSIDTIVVPRYPGVLCAAGLLSATVEHEAASAFVRKFAQAGVAEVLARCDRLAAECTERMREDGVDVAEVRTSCLADVCFVGQAHHIEVPFETDDPERLLGQLYDRFCALHEQLYGHATRSAAMFVNLRVVQRAAAAAEPAAAARRPATGTRPPARKGTRRILLDARADFVPAAVFDRDGLAPGDVIDGPAIVEQADTTTLVEPGWRVSVAPDESLIARKTS
ncbi:MULTISPECIES: hydantoinase/oxoprolinase family protein [Ramlibacter]|uniref:Hydantoinase/oxoprolinase family protein n=1 Tax=Ramlibacter pinisoli TaxID=2682844 RepID=A0A6N8J049_9BURK|nr:MULTISPECIES: hydantoinase/oxoprolinase family protein [Ramlibacter]MBA2962283.1 hydantoinase/oxoprolinase family protein [Ramlibacter sp. CGMCC 1.13660]MVQ32225.1 hydantoinase/oxoprolinase family protein [Ramlibacter pinisoli]